MSRGETAFVQRKEAVVLQLHLTEPAPDVRALRPEVSPDLAAAIAKSLAKLPADRWRSAAEMRDILSGCPVA